jgi:hypothetical protein
MFNMHSDYPPGYDPSAPETPGEPFACPIGVELWAQCRRVHPNAPAAPPEDPANLQYPMEPEAHEYFLHASSCDDCNEV